MDFSGFYKLPLEERLKIVKQYALLSDQEMAILKNSGALNLETAERMIENVIGVSHLPLGVATNFVINGKEYLIPMMLEEPSVVAAASNAAKLARPGGGFIADADEPVMIGQMQFVNLSNSEKALDSVMERKDDIIKVARSYASGIEKYGGGIRGMNARLLDSIRGKMLLVEFDVDVRDAMGANMVNTIMEGTAPTIAEMTGSKTRLRILTNLAIKRKARAKAIWKKEVIGEDSVEGVLDGYALALADIFRCSTHNKGAMNGIDAVALATGNDWRAVEAGAHSYAAYTGTYRPLTRFEKTREGDLAGSIELPIAAGTVGGAINTNPLAKISLKILGVKTSRELAMIMAAVGLANNFAAVRALATTGIQAGHMKLHARNIAVLAGAQTLEEIDRVATALAEAKDFSLQKAKEILAKRE